MTSKSIVAWGLTVAVASASCDRREDVAPAKTKTLNELKQAAAEKSSEELEKARKDAGWKSNDEVLSEAKTKYERDSKIYIKARLADYRKLVDDIRKQVDTLEKETSSWEAAKDPQKMIASFSARAKKDKTAILARYNEITANGTEGGNTQVALADTVHTWEGLLGEPSAELAKSETFKTKLADVRKKLDELSKTLDDVGKDATLVAEPDGASAEGGAVKGADDSKKTG